jgi:DnaJ-class molecular chaperone
MSCVNCLAFSVCRCSVSVGGRNCKTFHKLLKERINGAVLSGKVVKNTHPYICSKCGGDRVVACEVDGVKEYSLCPSCRGEGYTSHLG